MALVVDVPLNTMLADLDETLRVMLKRELGRHGFDGVEVAFDAPARDWSSQLSSPTVNLFLYDIRESGEYRPTEWQADHRNGHHREVRPPMIMECSYAVTAWTQAVEDEHRLLSQVLGVLYAYPILDGHLGSRFDTGSQQFEIRASVGEQRPEQRADFWRSVGGVYKPALDYVVTLSVESGMTVERGPDVRATTIRTGLSERRGFDVQELSNVGGIVTDADGEPVGDAWIAVPELGRLALSSGDGHFRLPRVPSGTHEVRVRGRDGGEATVNVKVPGEALDVVLGAAAKAGKKR